LPAQPEVGRLYRRCGCRSVDGRQFGGTCPRLRLESHGRWYFALQVDGQDGRRTRVRKGGYASRAEAEAALADHLALPSVEAMARTWTVRRFLLLWLSEQAKRLRPSTVLFYQRAVRTFLIPLLGHLRLAKLRVGHVQRAIDQISRTFTQGGSLLSPGTISGIRAVLRSALSDARRRGLVGFNAAWRLRMPVGGRPHAVVWLPEYEDTWCKTGMTPRVACWDLPHLVRFLEAVRDDRLFALWWLVALRGLRRGELAGLRWRDVDLAGGFVWVRETIVMVTGRAYVGPPKSAAGTRRLALDEASMGFLWEYWRAECRRRDGVPPSPEDPVFTYDEGGPVRPDWLTRRFRKLHQELDLPPVRLHDLRHGAASLAGAAGVPLKVIQVDTGHASAVTTADTYLQVFTQTGAEAIAMTAQYLLSQADIQLALGGASSA